jgi:hypothetical protein
VIIAFRKGTYPFIHKLGYHTHVTKGVTYHLYKWSK